MALQIRRPAPAARIGDVERHLEQLGRDLLAIVESPGLEVGFAEDRPDLAQPQRLGTLHDQPFGGLKSRDLVVDATGACVAHATHQLLPALFHRRARLLAARARAMQVARARAIEAVARARYSL